MSTTTPPTAQLDYAPQPAVGDVTVGRGPDGVTVVTLRSSWRRVGRALWPATALAAVVIALLAFNTVLSWHAPRSAMPVESAVVVTRVTAVVVVGSSARPLVQAMHPIRWEASPHGVHVTLRRPAQVFNEQYPAAALADFRVERVRLKNKMVFKRSGLVAIGPLGQRVVHLFGPPAELACIAGAFRDALGIGPDPLGEAAFGPPPPPWWSAVRRQVGRANVAVTLRPVRLPVDALAVGVPATLAGGATSVLECHAGLLPWATAAAAGAAVAAAVALLLGGGLLLVYRLRRTVSVAVDPAHLTLTEQTLIRPAVERWPTQRVAGVRMAECGRRGNLLLDLIDGTTVPLLTGQPIRAVRTMHDTLVVGLARVGVRSACILQP